MQAQENGAGELLSDGQVLDLPFKCETDFFKEDPFNDYDGWEVQLLDNEDQELFQELEREESEFFLLSLDMVSVVKPKAPKSEGGMRRVRHVAAEEETMDEGNPGPKEGTRR